MGVISNPSNMKEMCAYVAAQKQIRADGHRRLTLLNGTCSGLTDNEYNKIVTRQKSSFSKARKFTHNRMWQDSHKKFDIQQLKLIRKTL